jgi:hypothetical protein
VVSFTLLALYSLRKWVADRSGLEAVKNGTDIISLMEVEPRFPGHQLL